MKDVKIRSWEERTLICIAYNNQHPFSFFYAFMYENLRNLQQFVLASQATYNENFSMRQFENIKYEIKKVSILRFCKISLIID